MMDESSVVRAVKNNGDLLSVLSDMSQPGIDEIFTNVTTDTAELIFVGDKITVPSKFYGKTVDAEFVIFTSVAPLFYDVTRFD